MGLSATATAEGDGDTVVSADAEETALTFIFLVCTFCWEAGAGEEAVSSCTAAREARIFSIFFFWISAIRFCISESSSEDEEEEALIKPVDAAEGEAATGENKEILEEIDAEGDDSKGKKKKKKKDKKGKKRQRRRRRRR